MTVGVPVIQIDPGVLVAVDEVVDHRVIAAAGQLDPGRIRLDQREIFKGDIVADQVMVADRPREYQYRCCNPWYCRRSWSRWYSSNKCPAHTGGLVKSRQRG